MIPLYGEGDQMTMKFIITLAECSSSPNDTIIDICPNDHDISPLDPRSGVVMDALICDVTFISVELTKLVFVPVLCGAGHQRRCFEFYPVCQSLVYETFRDVSMLRGPFSGLVSYYHFSSEEFCGHAHLFIY
ncbi:hypothetical protein Tco_1376283 [Tanacetum coccineum]